LLGGLLLRGKYVKCEIRFKEGLVDQQTNTVTYINCETNMAHNNMKHTDSF
jgi:hypothetical protein